MAETRLGPGTSGFSGEQLSGGFVIWTGVKRFSIERLFGGSEDVQNGVSEDVWTTEIPPGHGMRTRQDTCIGRENERVKRIRMSRYGSGKDTTRT